MERPNTLQLTRSEIPKVEIPSCIRPLPGRFYAIESPIPEQLSSGLYLSEGAGTTLKNDAATVIAVGAGVDLHPGDVVLVRPNHGTWVEGFAVRDFRASGRTRIFGVAWTDDNEPVEIPWDDSAPVRVHAIKKGIPGRRYYRLPDKASVELCSWRMPRCDADGSYAIGETMSLSATGRNVLIKREPVIKSASGIELPDSEYYRTCLATVVSVGPACHGVSVGDRVHYDGMGVIDFLFSEDPDLALVKYEAINAVIEQAA